jgi:uncharacterized protein YjdB
VLVAVVACVADAGPMGPPAPVATVTVNPGASALTVGATQLFSATLRDSSGAILTGRSVSWSSLNETIAIVGSNGMATGQSVGSTSIRATSEGKMGDATLSVASPPPTLVRVILTPDTIVIFTGATRQFTAMGRMSDSTTVAITATFGANGGNITGAGLYTAGPAAGTFRVIAAAQGKADTSAVTIQLAPVASVTVVPSSQTIAVAGTVQLVATPRDAGGNALTGRVVTWQTSNPAIASVSGGLVTGQAAGGPVTITASSEGHDGTAAITVSASAPTLVRVILSPDSATVFTAATQQFTTTGRMSDSTTVPLAPTYSATGGSINSSGVYTAGNTTGTFRVIAASQGKADTSPVVIQPRPVATVTLTPASATIGILGTVQLTATLRDAQGNVLTGRPITWGSLNLPIATVNAGLVTGVAVGTALITATSEGQADTATITVALASSVDTLFVDGFESGNLNAWDDRYESQRQTVQTNATQAHAGSRYLQLEYPSGADGGGAVTKFFGFGFPTGNNSGGYDKLYVRYWVKFPSNWQGGTKLLLLRGSRTDNQWSSFGVAGQCPSGTNFFATNVVTLNQSTLPLRFYSYYVGMARESDGVTCYGRHGNNEDPGGTPNPAASYFAPLDVSKNVWHLVEFEVTLNTPGQSNGVQQFWLDGVLKGEWSGLNFRTQSVLKLNALTLEASMNGPNTSPQTQTLSIDDVLVATGRP